MVRFLHHFNVHLFVLSAVEFIFLPWFFFVSRQHYSKSRGQIFVKFLEVVALSMQIVGYVLGMI